MRNETAWSSVRGFQIPQRASVRGGITTNCCCSILEVETIQNKRRIERKRSRATRTNPFYFLLLQLLLHMLVVGWHTPRIVVLAFHSSSAPLRGRLDYFWKHSRHSVHSSLLRTSSNSNSHSPPTSTAPPMDSTTGATPAPAPAPSIWNCPSIPMRNGLMHPAIGFGTYKVGYVPPSSSSVAAGNSSAGVPLRSAVAVMADALTAGYRFLECAQFYNNQAEIGQAIAAYSIGKNDNNETAATIDTSTKDDSSRLAIPRQELFLCSKVWTTTIEQGSDAIRAQLEQTLTDFQTDYLDLYLIHWPVPIHHVTAYKTLIELKHQGKIRGIGVSNYAWEDYLELKNDPAIADADLPVVNQIEINPFLYRARTIAHFQAEGVVLQSYRSLRDGKAMNHPVFQALAASYGKTPAQILGRWCVQHGFVYTPKSTRMERMVENAAVFDFALAPNDMDTLDALTTPEALRDFEELYRKCVNRDTSKAGSMDGVKMNITVD